MAAESNNGDLWFSPIIKGQGRHLITSAVEHHAVLHTFEYLVNKEGFELTHYLLMPTG